MTAVTEPQEWTVRTFRITTYFKRKRGSGGITQLASKRIPVAVALQWVLDELPDEAWEVDQPTPENGDTATVTIDWSKVPGRGLVS